jgi:hypothetical protein
LCFILYFVSKSDIFLVRNPSVYKEEASSSELHRILYWAANVHACSVYVGIFHACEQIKGQGALSGSAQETEISGRSKKIRF